MKIIAYWKNQEYKKMESILVEQSEVTIAKLPDNGNYNKRKPGDLTKIERDKLVSLVEMLNHPKANVCTIRYTPSRIFEIKYFKVDDGILKEYLQWERKEKLKQINSL